MGSSIRELDMVELCRDLPEFSLRRGDAGAVVLVHEGAFEVEFVTTSGRKESVVTVNAADVRLARKLRGAR